MTNYVAIPDFGQLVEYITQGPLVGDTYGVVINRVNMAQMDLTNPLSSNSIRSDYHKVAALRPVSDLTTPELTAVKTNLQQYRRYGLRFSRTEQRGKGG